AMEVHEEGAAIEWSRRAIAIAEPRANQEILSHALTTLGAGRLIGGDTDGWADLDRGLQIALSADLQEEVARSYVHLSVMAVSRRQYERATRYLGDGLT